MFFDLVVCTYPLDTKKYLYIAPAFSYLEAGDEVVVQETDGKRHAIVVDTTTLLHDDKKFSFIINAMGAQTPLPRITEKVVYSELDWTQKEAAE